MSQDTQRGYAVTIGFPVSNMADWELRHYVEPDMGAADPEGQARAEAQQRLQDLQGEGFDVQDLTVQNVERVK